MRITLLVLIFTLVCTTLTKVVRETSVLFVLLALLVSPAHASNITCLAQTLYHESRSEPVSAQLLIARVTLNRAADLYVKGYAAPRSRIQTSLLNVCKVVAMPHQYSWWGYRMRIKDRLSYEKSLTLAKVLLSSKTFIVGRSRYFNRVDLGKRYATKTKPVIVAETIIY
jgi:hypothetical protein